MKQWSDSRAAAVRRVVLVDDDAAVRSALTFALEAEGYVVLSFADAETVLMQEPAADCYVIDDRLPGGMSGLDLVRELRTNAVTVPAVIITTHPTMAVIHRAKALGVPIVEKPLIGPALALTLEGLIGPPRP
ncbi:MAG: response regulator [Bauldia sp.]